MTTGTALNKRFNEQKNSCAPTVRFNLKNTFSVLDNLCLNQALGVVHLWPDRPILLRKFVVSSVDILRSFH